MAKPPCGQLGRIALQVRPSHPEGRLIEFFAQMPIGAMILLTLAVLGLAATL